MPATGLLSGNARVHHGESEVPQTVAIDDEPFDSVISETTMRIVYGKLLLFAGITGCTARQASLP